MTPMKRLAHSAFTLPRLLTTSLVPIVFFAALLFSRASVPNELVFDEIHYAPAAQALITLTDDLNWVHPPGAKLIMGAGWALFTRKLHLLGEPTVFRCVAVVFGLWTLWAVGAWMTALAFRPGAVTIAVWLTGFNFLWFVQSKTAMLDIFYVAFALWGLLDVWRGRSTAEYARGWIFLGISLSCKWAAAPFLLLAFAAGGRSTAARVAGGIAAAVVYSHSARVSGEQCRPCLGASELPPADDRRLCLDQWRRSSVCLTLVGMAHAASTHVVSLRIHAAR
jgi:hypothetical protein